MAVSRRTLSAVLAGCALAAATVSPALAYWKANGRGTGTVPTSSAAANVITLQLVATGTGHTIKASGKAGSGSPYASSVNVVLCKNSTFPCTTQNQIVTLTATVSAGNYSVTSGNLNSTNTVYGQATQAQTSGWIDYSAVPPVVNNP